MRKLIAITAALAIAVVTTTAISNAADKDDAKAKTSIKDVMKKGFKGGLCKKVASGAASTEEKAQLAKMLTALAAAKPPVGDAKSWKAKTTALLAAVKANDGVALKKAANCAACHKAHKPKKK